MFCWQGGGRCRTGEWKIRILRASPMTTGPIPNCSNAACPQAKGAKIPCPATALARAEGSEPGARMLRSSKAGSADSTLIVKYRKICILPGTVLHPQNICIFSNLISLLHTAVCGELSSPVRLCSTDTCSQPRVQSPALQNQNKAKLKTIQPGTLA